MMQSRIVTTLGVAALAASCLQFAAAGNRSGTVSGLFLKLPVAARAAGMGNAQVALAEGPISIGYNPAGILSVPSASFGATYNQWFADITHAFLGGAFTIDGYGSFGLGATVLTTDDMIVRTPYFPEGTGELFRASEFAYTFSVARQITDQFGLGLSVKYIRSYLDNSEHKSSTIAFDIGTLYDIPTLKTRLGISVNNLGRDLKYINEQYSLPTALRFGARTTVLEEEDNKAYVVLQIGRPNDAEEQYNFGVEYIFQELVAFRGGYKFNYDTENWTGGMGISLKSLGLLGQLDYAYSNYKYLPGTHMFTLELGL